MHRYIITTSRGLFKPVPRKHRQQAWTYAGIANSKAQPSRKITNDYRIVQFIHESVREHIISGGLAELSPELSPDVEGRGHAMLAWWHQAFTRGFSPKLTAFPTHPVHGIIIDVGQISLEHIKEF